MPSERKLKAPSFFVGWCSFCYSITDYFTYPLKIKRITDNMTNPNDIHSKIKDSLYFSFRLVTSDAIAPAKTTIGL